MLLITPASGCPAVPPTWKVAFALNVPPPPSTVYHDRWDRPPAGLPGLGGVVGGVRVGVPAGHDGSVKVSKRPWLRPPVLHSNWVCWLPVSRCVPTVAPDPALGTVP